MSAGGRHIDWTAEYRHHLSMYVGPTSGRCGAVIMTINAQSSSYRCAAVIIPMWSRYRPDNRYRNKIGYRSDSNRLNVGQLTSARCPSRVEKSTSARHGADLKFWLCT
ncbi:Uncharacterised protein r2_g77 [Pycnogonum litorale]